jgi:DNA-directed RNA polymerase
MVVIFIIKKKKHLFLHNSNKNAGVIKIINKNIIKSINYLSNIELTININVLKVIFKLLEIKNENLNKLILVKLHSETPNLFKLKLSGIINTGKVQEILRHNSQYYNNTSILMTALAYSNLGTEFNSLFIPYFIDFRGRFYPKSGFFAPQNGELARSLIKFKKGIVLTDTSLTSLQIYTANCYGLDKQSYDQRLYWFKTNVDKIKSIGLDNNWDFIFTANEPLLFLSCVLELQQYYKNPKEFKSSLPVYLDATCSGLQHLASMVKDENLSKYVNLTKST